MNFLNKQISDLCRKRDFITALYGYIDLQKHKFVYTNCGHNYPLILSPSGNVSSLDDSGPSLNLVVDSGYKSTTVDLEPGEIIILYTDGVTEIFNDDKEEFGLERLKNVLSGSFDEPAGGVVKNVVNSTKDFSKRRYYLDDFTVLVLKRNKIN
jgi:sigma-B regulation protein RsbU (phosphoserine phosphatase)